MTNSADRCRNCGLLHKTHACPSYGPMFPAPGKEKGDYAKLHQEIQDMLAADILAEHHGHDHEDIRTPSRIPGSGVKEPELTYQSVVCPTCDSKPETACISRSGLNSRSHKARIVLSKQRQELLQ